MTRIERMGRWQRWVETLRLIVAGGPDPEAGWRGRLWWILCWLLYGLARIVRLPFGWPSAIRRNRLRSSPEVVALFAFGRVMATEPPDVLDAAERHLHAAAVARLRGTGAQDLLCVDVLADELAPTDTPRWRELFELLGRGPPSVDTSRLAVDRLQAGGPQRPLVVLCLRFMPRRLATELDRAVREAPLDYLGLVSIERRFAEEADLLRPFGLAKFKEWTEAYREGWRDIPV